MSELSLRNLVKIYPYAKVNGRIFGRKKAREALEKQRRQPYTTNEGILAIHEFSLDVEQGEFLVLLGPSGCGKSTILRMIAGLESVSDGDVLIDGVSVVDVPPEQRDMAMIFQNYSLYPNYTVAENIAFPLKNRHLPREQIDAMVREIAEMLELEDLLDRRPKELSGGQRQRTAIGRALVRRPRFFLMDEPFSNLDPVLRQKLRRKIKELHQKLGITFLYVTHDQMEAFALGERIVVMRDGMIEQVGTPQELFNRPANLYTATFVGTPPMNTAEGVTLTHTKAGWQFSLFGIDVPLSSSQSNGLSPQDRARKVTVGIRPVHVLPGDTGADATVDFVDVLEGELILHLEIGGAEWISVVSSANVGKYRKGQKIKVGFAPGKFHIFDAGSGKRIG